MDDILAKKNRHLFLEEKGNQNNSFIGNINDVANRKEELDTVAAHITNVDTVGDHIDNVDTVANNISDINDAVDNIATVKTFNDNVNNGTMQYLLEAFTTSLNAQGNAWEVRLTQLGESILATTSAFNYSTVVTISSDIPANGTLTLPNAMKYKVGTHMLMVSWNGTVCYAGEQYDEVGAYGVWATSIKLNQPAKAGDKIQLRIVALTDQSSYVDITEAAINASQFTASGSNTERYLPEFLGDVVNVKNFGAVGNGVNDDTTAFQSAIASGKAVFVPEGTYKLSTDLNGAFCGVGNSTFTGGTVNGSTILRGVAQKNNDVINVKDFGSKGDGTTNDTSAWNVAVTVAAGKKIYVPKGSYKIIGEVADADFFSFDDVTFTNLHIPVNNPNYTGSIAKKTICFIADFKFPDYDSLLGTADLIWPQAANVFEKNGKKYLFVLSGKSGADTLEENNTWIALVYNYKTQEYIGYFLLPGCATTESICVRTENDVDYIYAVSADHYLIKFAFDLEDLNQTLTSTNVKNSSNQNVSAMWFFSYCNGVWAVDSIYNRLSGFVSRTLMLYNESFDIISQYDIQKYQQDIWESYDNEYSDGWTISRTQGIAVGQDGVYFFKGGGTNSADTETALTDLGVEHYTFQGELIRSSVCDHTKFVSKINNYLGLSLSNTHSECESGFIDKNGKCFWFGVFGSIDGKIVVLEEFSSDSASIDFTDCLDVKHGNAVYQCNLPVFPRGHNSKYYNPWNGEVFSTLGDFILFCAKYGIDNIWINSNTDLVSTINGTDLCIGGDKKYQAHISRQQNDIYFVTILNASSVCQETFVVNLSSDFSSITSIYKQDDNVCSLYRCRDNSNFVNICGGTGIYDGARITLYGKDKTSYGGIAEIRGGTSQSTYSHIVIEPTTTRISGDAFSPEVDNTTDLGLSQKRWKQLYSNSSTINTSDERLKDHFESPSESLMKAWGKVRFTVFQYKDAIEKKGDLARLHVGVVAQQVQQAFASEGLDANRYGLFCYDEWEEETKSIEHVVREAVYDDSGNLLIPEEKIEEKIHTPAGNVYSIRYEEALVLECAYQRWLGEQRDAKIEALMQRISALENNH